MSQSDDRPAAGQEAARLLAAAQGWLRTSAPHLAPTGADGAPCSCPVCRAVVSLRDADPDSVARWVDTAVAGASSALAHMAAAAGDLGGQRPSSDPGTDEDSPGEATAYADEPDAGRSPHRADVGHDEPPSARVRRVPLDPDHLREPGGPTA